MPHLLVDQLRFTRSEYMSAVGRVPPEDAVVRLEPMNCIVGNIDDRAPCRPDR